MDDMWESIVHEYNSKQLSYGPPDDSIKIDLLTPQQIVAELDKTVIGQEKAKQLIAIAVWNRLLAINNKNMERDDEEYFFEKNNIMLMGGTGCGKTHMVKALSQAVSLPVTIQDATSFTSAGYVGRDIDQSIDDLVTSAEEMVNKNYDISTMTSSKRKKLIKELTEYGIVYIDEADKVRAAASSGKDVNGRSVQEAFLKLIEGTELKVSSAMYRGVINTSNMLFIFGGAFGDMDKIISARTNAKTIGFNATLPTKEDKSNLLEKAGIEDFTKFGMIPELMGRLSTIAVLKELDREMISRIFTEPRRSIMSQVINEFKSYGVDASFSDDAINHIVDKTMKIKLGARGLKSVCQEVLRPLFFYLPSNPVEGSLIITKEMLLDIEEKGL